jgi:phosphatidylinositol alpha-1,6-mannosyltransferase
MGRPTLWIVTPELHHGDGTEHCLAEQVQRWRERFDIRLYTMRISEVEVRGIAVRRIPWLPGPHLVKYIWWFAANTVVRIWDARRLGAPDVVHSPGINCFDADIMSVHMIFGKHREGAARISVRDLSNWPFLLRAGHRLVYRSLVDLLERLIYAGPSTLWAISHRDAADLAACFGRPAGSVPVLPHGVDTRYFCPEARRERRDDARVRLGVAGKRVILLVGNDAQIKGVDVGVRALSFLPPDVVLAVAGRVDEARVRSWAREGSVEDRVFLWPHIQPVIDYYAAADVLAAPSREDAYHLPAIEAVACGLPVVISAAAGAAELMQDGRHALILHDASDPAECARLVERVLEDRGLAEDLGRNGRALAERYSWEANARRAQALIEREAATPRVLVLAPSAWGTGGIERATRMLLQALGDLYGPERVGLLSIRGGAASLPCRTMWAGPDDGRGRRVPAWAKVRFAVAAALAARRWRRRLIVVAFHPHLASVARWCARVSGAPYIVWCHGLEAWGQPRSSVRRALQAADAVVAPSQFTAALVEKAAGIDHARLVVLPYALPGELPTVVRDGPQPTKPPTVLSVARLVPEHAYKGIDTLVRVWPQVVEAVPEARLHVVGDGPDRPRLASEARRLELNGRVVFRGALDDAALARAYGEARVFALPVRTRVGRLPAGEGFGFAYVEAAAAGLPVVAGNGGAIPEVVRDGETGLLVDADAPDDVAAGIVRLLRDPELADRLGRAGRRHALEQFSFERFRKRLGDLFAQLNRRRRTGRRLRRGAAPRTVA